MTHISSIQFTTDVGEFDNFAEDTKNCYGVAETTLWSRSVQMSVYPDHCQFLWVVRYDGVDYSYYDTIAQNPYGVAECKLATPNQSAQPGFP